MRVRATLQHGALPNAAFNIRPYGLGREAAVRRASGHGTGIFTAPAIKLVEPTTATATANVAAA